MNPTIDKTAMLLLRCSTSMAAFTTGKAASVLLFAKKVRLSVRDASAAGSDAWFSGKGMWIAPSTLAPPEYSKTQRLVGLSMWLVS